MAGTPPPSSRKRKDTTPTSTLVPTPGSGLPPPTPDPPAKLTLAYLFRAKPDKHLSYNYHYPGQPNKWVAKNDCSDLISISTAMQKEDLIKLHGKERYKKGEYGVKEPNPDYEYFPGYGNHKTIGEVTLPAARCVEVTKQRFDQHASNLIEGYTFAAIAETKGDPHIKFETVEAFIEYINGVPEPTIDEEEEDLPPAAAQQLAEWQAKVEQRIATLEKLAGLASF